MPCGKDYPVRLQALLGADYLVLNSGDGGENSITIPARQGAIRLTTVALRRNPAFNFPAQFQR